MVITEDVPECFNRCYGEAEHSETQWWVQIQNLNSKLKSGQIFKSNSTPLEKLENQIHPFYIFKGRIGIRIESKGFGLESELNQGNY